MLFSLLDLFLLSHISPYFSLSLRIFFFLSLSQRQAQLLGTKSCFTYFLKKSLGYGRHYRFRLLPVRQAHDPCRDPHGPVHQGAAAQRHSRGAAAGAHSVLREAHCHKPGAIRWNTQS